MLTVYHNEFCYETQSVDLKSVANARQLGSYLSSDGRRVKKDVLLRCGVLSKLTDDDKKLLIEKYDIKYVYDLRTEFEYSRSPDAKIDGAKYINMPIEDVDNSIWLTMYTYPGNNEYEQLLNFARTERAQSMVRQMYIGYVSDEFCQLQFAAFIESLIHSEGAVLWHCSQGKDRTGLIAAILLSIFGVDRETIIKDFALTNTQYQPIVDNLVATLLSQDAENGVLLEESQKAIEVIQAIEGVNVRYFIDALDYIDTIYGSMERYIKTVLVVTDEEIKFLRDKFLE